MLEALVVGNPVEILHVLLDDVADQLLLSRQFLSIRAETIHITESYAVF